MLCLVLLLCLKSLHSSEKGNLESSEQLNDQVESVSDAEVPVEDVQFEDVSEAAANVGEDIQQVGKSYT